MSGVIQEPGVYRGMTREEYDSVERLNWSRLKWMSKSPAHFRHICENPEEETDARKLGHCVHLSLFEPERFASSVATWIGGRRYGKEWDRFCDEHQGQTILTAAEYQKCVAIADAVRRNRLAAPYLRGGSAEVSVFWDHVVPSVSEATEETLLGGYQVKCKGRLDYLTSSAIVDLKSTRDASVVGFGREAWRLQYLAQAAYYQDGLTKVTGERLPYVIIAAENIAPYAVSVFRVPDHFLEMGRDSYRSYLDTLDHCRRTNEWLEYVDDVVELELPRYALPFGQTNEDMAGLDLAWE
jgi:hypothetical protein